ncbi:MAG TPA: peptidoglycan recognition family protein [Ferruginibacter sp.]|nr:peptidoglycan recognition family protein [Ferruginibacter sp.]
MIYCHILNHNKINSPALRIPFLLTAFFLLLLNSCSNNRFSKPATNITIEPRSSWNALEAKAYKSQVPVRITVHHEGTKLELTDDAAKKINAIQRWGMGPDKKWADIPYHFLIAPNGTVYEGRNAYTVGETSTEYEPTGHLLICCLGNRETDPVPDAQLKALIKLIAFSSTKFNIPVDSLSTHKDYSKQTTCPGKYLYAYFENGFIKKELKKLQK